MSVLTRLVRPVGPRQRAVHLLIAGLLVALVGWIGVLVVGAATQQLGAAVAGGLITIVFFGLGQLVLVATATAEPAVALMSALGSYVVRLAGLAAAAILLAGSFTAAGRLALGISIIVVVICWLVGEVVLYARMRIPSFDPPEARSDADTPG